MKNNSYDKKMFRLMYILNRLSAGAEVTSPNLAKEFNVTVRTVQRDLNLLEATGFPLILENGRYKFAEGFSLKKISVTKDEKFMLMLFYKLFSQTDRPLNETAKKLLDKVLVSPEGQGAVSKEISLKHKRKVLSEEFDSFSETLALRLETCVYPRLFIKKIDEYLADMKKRVKLLSKKNNVIIKQRFLSTYANEGAVAYIDVPKEYFKGRAVKYDYEKEEKNREFMISTSLPDKRFKNTGEIYDSPFRISLRLDLYFNFWGTHFKNKKICCFDEFAKCLGFTKEEKRLVYHYSYAGGGEQLFTRASLFWEKEIPMPAEEIKPFLKNRRPDFGITYRNKRKK